MRDDLPIFGVCGRSGAGKTTLIEALVPSLLSHNLSVAVAKHWAHGLDVDHPGKDSDRLFRAGADVFLEGPGQGFARIHPSGDAGRPAGLKELAHRYDLVLVEGGERVDRGQGIRRGEGAGRGRGQGRRAPMRRARRP